MKVAALFCYKLFWVKHFYFKWTVQAKCKKIPPHFPLVCFPVCCRFPCQSLAAISCWRTLAKRIYLPVIHTQIKFVRFLQMEIEQNFPPPKAVAYARYQSHCLWNELLLLSFSHLHFWWFEAHKLIWSPVVLGCWETGRLWHAGNLINSCRNYLLG